MMDTTFSVVRILDFISSREVTHILVLQRAFLIADQRAGRVNASSRMKERKRNVE